MWPPFSTEKGGGSSVLVTAPVSRETLTGEELVHSTYLYYMCQWSMDWTKYRKDIRGGIIRGSRSSESCLLDWRFKKGRRREGKKCHTCHIRDSVVHMCIYHQLYINRPDPIAFLPAAVDTTGRLYDDFSRLLFCRITVKFRLLQTKYRRNRVNFDSFVRPVMLILKGQWGWFWRKLRTWGFQYLLTCHPSLLSLSRALFVGDVLFHF